MESSVSFGGENSFNQRAGEDDAVRMRKQYLQGNDPTNALLTFGIVPNEPDAHSIDTKIAELRKSREIGARLITLYIALGHYDIFHQCTIQKLADANLLVPYLVYSHDASMTDSELGAIRESGAGIVSTPDTEMQMGTEDPGSLVFRAGDMG